MRRAVCRDSLDAEHPKTRCSRILGPVRPGGTLVTRVDLVKELGELALFEAECSVNQQLVARGRFMLSRQLKGTDNP